MSPESPLPGRSRKNKKHPLLPTGHLLKTLRKASGYSQEEIAGMLGFRAPSAVSKLERRDFTPDVQRLKKLLNVLRATDEQQAEILVYFGYQPADLEQDFSPPRAVRHHAEQHPVLRRLQELFYLFTYQRNYQQVLYLVDEYLKEPLELPQVFDAVQQELRPIVQNLFACRRLLAQGTMEHRLTELEEAQNRIETIRMAFELIDLKLAAPEPFGAQFLLQLRLQVLLAAHSCLYKQLNLRHRQGQGLPETQSLFDTMQQLYLPEIQAVLERLKHMLPKEELNESYQMYLFIRRDELQLLLNQCDRKDELRLKGLIPKLKFNGHVLACFFDFWQKNKKTDRSELLGQVYQQLFAPDPQNGHALAELESAYAQVLKEHQLLAYWDAESPEVMKAILHTLLEYAPIMAKRGNFDAARLFLDTIYLRLNLSETHYHWASNYAMIYAVEYLSRTRLQKPDAEHLVLLESVCRLLDKAFDYLEHSRQLKAEDYIRYTFDKEPIFFFLFLHAEYYGLHSPVVDHVKRRREELEKIPDSAGSG